MTDERVRQFFSWFYNSTNEPTEIWTRLEGIARDLPPGQTSGDVVDEVIVVLLSRIRSKPATIFPVPLASDRPLSDEPDFLDVLRYAQAAVRNAIRDLRREEADRRSSTFGSLQSDDDDFDPTDDHSDPEFFPGRRSYTSDPAEGALASIETPRNLECWAGALECVRDAMRSNERTAHPAYREACLRFLEEFLKGVKQARDDGAQTVEARAATEAMRFLADLPDPPVRLARAFHTQFHYAFWRSAGALMAGAWARLEVTEPLLRIATLAGVDPREFMVEQHEGMVRNWPLPFTPRGSSNGVSKRALLARGRESLWGHLVHLECSDADPWPPPTKFVIGEELGDA
ncbi:MAG: hypothetical protein IT300_16725 [Dehalococcoidia bacterium]|nr:hypothetical protein [Dehalococcoidia bacterium]